MALGQIAPPALLSAALLSCPILMKCAHVITSQFLLVQVFMSVMVRLVNYLANHAALLRTMNLTSKIAISKTWNMEYRVLNWNDGTIEWNDAVMA